RDHRRPGRRRGPPAGRDLLRPRPPAAAAPPGAQRGGGHAPPPRGGGGPAPPGRAAPFPAPDRRLPLPPAELSEPAPSLLPGGERPAVLWCIDLDADGAPVATRVERAVVRSRAQLTYEEGDR